MRILHTSDWHLGKNIYETHSRLDEQRKFIDELATIVDEREIDMLIIAGDIYDTQNPPAAAEQLFYSAVRRLSAGGVRPIIVIAGNHDNPARLCASSPLATELGIVLLGTPKSIARPGDYDTFSITASGEGFLELELHGESAVIVAMPYPGEKTLNELLLSDPGDEKKAQKSYSQKIGERFESLSGYYRDDTINIAVGHFYIIGGETSSSEREIQFGGSYAVDSDVLPLKAQYVAMGHLHRAQKIARFDRGYYAGAPIQYSVSEAGQAKSVYIVELHPGKEAAVEKVFLRNYKPIIVLKASGVEDALKQCMALQQENVWLIVEIHTNDVIFSHEIKELRSIKRDIIAVVPVRDDNASQDACDADIQQRERSLSEEFYDFYLENRRSPPAEELMELFLSLCETEDDCDNSDIVGNISG